MFKSLQLGMGALAGIMLLASASPAQLQVGPDLHMTASGNLSAGYSAGYGDQTASQHALTLGGDVGVNGYYYAPSFISFHALPYYDQSRANSNYQSISGSSGLTSGAEFFTGSHFPGSISFSKMYNSTGTYGMAGTPSFTTHGNSVGYSIGWSALLPNLPTLTASYSAGSGSSDVYGTDAHSNSTNRNLNLRSSYNLNGFRLTAQYGHGSNKSELPAFLSGVSNYVSNSTSSNENFSVQHKLPWNGSFSASVMRSTSTIQSQGTGSSDYTANTVQGSALFVPMSKLSFSMGASYSDSLAGTLVESIVSAGGSPVSVNLGSTSHSTSLNAGMGYSFASNLGMSAVVTHQDQYYGGKSYGATYMSGTLFYNRKLFNMFSFSLTALDSATDAGNEAVGMQGNVSFDRRFGRWETTANFSYGQNVQTLLITYTTSYMTYSTNVRRRFTRYLTFTSGFSGSHSGFSQQAGTTSHGESYTSGLSYRSYTVSGGYSSSNGISVLTTNGLSTAGIVGVISPLSQIFYNGRSYNASASATPISKLSIAAGYSNSRSSTISSTISSLNQATSFTSQVQYKVRRMGIMAGYTRFVQGISASGVSPAGASSYYVGINRWINLF